MQWKIPPTIKVLEALGAIGDNRIELSGNTAKVYSSSRGKFYTITFSEAENAIMANDNGSFWQGYLGYPAITYLMAIGKLQYDPKFAEALAGIAWKDINTKFKNDFQKTESYVKRSLAEKGISENDLDKAIGKILASIKEMKLSLLGTKTKPPQGY